jgi:hypothetical protein
VDDHAICIGAAAQHGSERRTVAGPAHAAANPQVVRAASRIAAAAGRARVAARCPPRDDDAVAGRHVRDILAHGLDGAGAFV